MQSMERLCMGCMRDNGGETICRFCGFNESLPREGNSLPLRTWLAERYLVGNMLDVNGEGIVYIGWDTVEDTAVQIREFVPKGLCRRDTDSINVHVFSEHAKIYDDGLNAFMELAAALDRLRDLPALFPVHDVFEENGTAYTVYEDVEAISLQEYLLRNSGTLDWQQARPLFLTVMSTLSTLHAAGIYHRGISQHTLYIDKQGKLRLSGFCIPEARTARSDYAAQLFPGYAAIEQYGFQGQQGPWTDVYALAASLFTTLVGDPPPPATERVTNDTISIPYQKLLDLPEEVTDVLYNALQILPEDRTQSIEKLQADLISANKQARPATEEFDAVKHGSPDRALPTSRRRHIIMGVICAFLALCAVVFILCISVLRGTLFGNNADESSTSVTSAFSSDLASQPSSDSGDLSVNS